jgi:alpha-beta hydrolase superfamily lysophospholipase
MNFRMSTMLSMPSLLLATLFAQAAYSAPVCDANGELRNRFNLPVYEWSDPDVLPKATIVAVHGLTFYAAAYDDLASELAEKGYRFIAIDMRGFGRWQNENDKFGGDNLIHFTQTYDDVLKLITTLKQEQPELKLFAMGESLGANVALDLVSRNPDLCDGVILGSPCYKAKIHPKPRWAIDMVKGLQNPNRKLNLTPYITPYLSHSKELTTACLKDKRICRNLSPVELVKAQRTISWALLHVDKLPEEFPVLVVAGELDAVYNTKSLPGLFKTFGTKRIDVNIFPDRGHLLLEHQSVMPEISSIFDRWLTEQTATERVVQLPTDKEESMP